MIFTQAASTGAGGPLRVMAVAVVTVLMLIYGAAGFVSAHGGEEEFDALTLARQARAALLQAPPKVELALDRVRDAQEAEEAEGVDLGLLNLAEQAIVAGAPEAAPTLITRAVGEDPTMEAGPAVEVQLTSSVYWIVFVSLVLVGLGAFELGRRSGRASVGR